MKPKRTPAPSRFQLVVREPALFAARQAAAAEIGELGHRQLALHLLDKVNTMFSSGELSLRDYEDEGSRFSRREAEEADFRLERLEDYIKQIRAIVSEGTEGGAS